MPGFTFFTFKLVLSEDFSKDESNKWSGNKELPEEGHWKVSYDELTAVSYTHLRAHET